MKAYDVVETPWHLNDMHALFDLLKWYCLLDVRPFLEAVLVYLTQYKDRGLDLFKTAISLPVISLNWAFDTIAKEHKFHWFSQRHADIGRIMRNNLTGGPSIISHRQKIKDVTKLYVQSLVTMPMHYISGVQLKTCPWGASVFFILTQKVFYWKRLLILT